MPQWMYDAAAGAAIISLVISIYVAVKVRAIAMHYRQLALVPKVKSRIRTHLKNLEKQLQTKDWPGFRKEAAAAAAAAAQATSITTGAAKRSANDALAAARGITDVSATSFRIGAAEKLVLALVEMETHLTQFIESKKWQ